MAGAFRWRRLGYIEFRAGRRRSSAVLLIVTDVIRRRPDTGANLEEVRCATYCVLRHLPGSRSAKSIVPAGPQVCSIVASARCGPHAPSRGKLRCTKALNPAIATTCGAASVQAEYGARARNVHLDGVFSFPVCNRPPFSGPEDLRSGAPTFRLGSPEYTVPGQHPGSRHSQVRRTFAL